MNTHTTTMFFHKDENRILLSDGGYTMDTEAVTLRQAVEGWISDFTRAGDTLQTYSEAVTTLTSPITEKSSAVAVLLSEDTTTDLFSVVSIHPYKIA